ncbi:MFS general substrate transporter [Stereum hirsutum FP-91666 SS1]|uniref:MFS general substrate transporter n=1 Tax=Stereum hirsutum (strain FP-91666) TaxID=721885 RepID=UPI000440E60B|nr:MFS general substrate transporter [Stereum hirsutum FP-91666 SS1]EIM88537.1 MFS general substrate transporter [Stereum hirsutum FP-91666 SS1]
MRKPQQLLLGQGSMSRTERTLLLKIDWFILSYCCLMYFTNYLDRANVSNAYVSGMKEELNMVGNQYNQINTLFTCGYIVGMIPNNLMLQIVRPRIWLPAMQIIWGVLTFCTSAVTNVHQIFAIRFLQGMAESSTFVGVHYILGSWYKPGELGKRSAIFTCSGLVGTLFSGVLQAAVYQNLNGHDGRSGWRWLFIIDGVITLPIALYGFLVFPDVPAITKAFYLSEEERLLSTNRLDTVDTAHHPLSWNLVRRVLGRWRYYACSALFAISGETESFGSNNLMGQWLKAIGGYSVENIDYYPSGVTAFGIASTLICAVWTDRNQARWPVLVYMCICCIVASICILVWSSPTGLKFFAYYLAGASYAGQATTFAWANQICADDDQERAIVLASMNMWNNVINAWWPLVFYPATDAPRFKKGMIAMLAVAAATLVVTWLVWYLERREKRIAALNSHEVEGETRSAGGSREGSMVGVGEHDLNDGPKPGSREKDQKDGGGGGGREHDREDVMEKETEDVDA